MKKIILSILTIFILSSFNYTQVKKTGSVRKIGYMTFSATSYCLKGSKMANGQYPRYGYIAADTSILKLGTKVHIENLGIFIVGDRGGKIRGNKIDIYYPNCSQSLKFGRKNVFLTIL